MYDAGHTRPECGHPRESSRQHYCAECARSSTYSHNIKREPTHAYVHACMLIYKAVSMDWRTGDERKAENRPPRGCWGRAIFARSCARTCSPISSSSIELLYMNMHDNISANWRACMGALQTSARANSDPQRVRRGLETPRLCVQTSARKQSPHARTCANPSV
jgi:hypothetical protein